MTFTSLYRNRNKKLFSPEWLDLPIIFLHPLLHETVFLFLSQFPLVFLPPTEPFLPSLHIVLGWLRTVASFSLFLLFCNGFIRFSFVSTVFAMVFFGFHWVFFFFLNTCLFFSHTIYNLRIHQEHVLYMVNNFFQIHFLMSTFFHTHCTFFVSIRNTFLHIFNSSKHMIYIFSNQYF